MFAFTTLWKSHNLSEKDAKLLLDEKDKRYHKRHLALTGSNRGDRHNRDILINSDFLGIQGTAEYLEELIAKKYGRKEAMTYGTRKHQNLTKYLVHGTYL